MRCRGPLGCGGVAALRDGGIVGLRQDAVAQVVDEPEIQDRDGAADPALRDDDHGVPADEIPFFVARVASEAAVLVKELVDARGIGGETLAHLDLDVGGVLFEDSDGVVGKRRRSHLIQQVNIRRAIVIDTAIGRIVAVCDVGWECFDHRSDRGRVRRA